MKTTSKRKKTIKKMSFDEMKDKYIGKKVLQKEIPMN